VSSRRRGSVPGLTVARRRRSGPAFIQDGAGTGYPLRRCNSDQPDVTPAAPQTSQGQGVREPQTPAELEEALAEALVGLKAATEARRRLPARSPDLVQAVHTEREAMERIQELIILLRREGD
jgi:hypothetical protein